MKRWCPSDTGGSDSGSGGALHVACWIAWVFMGIVPYRGSVICHGCGYALASMHWSRWVQAAQPVSGRFRAVYEPMASHACMHVGPQG